MQEDLKYRISLEDLFSKGIKNAESNASSFEKTVSGIKSQLATLGLGIGIAATGKAIFEAGTNMESLNVSLKTMLGNKADADKLVAEMVQFAATTPFQQSEVATAGKQLLAYGIAAKDIVPTLKQLGDVSAGLAQPIGEIAYLYGTIRTQGKAMTIDIRQFANRGIPIYAELAKVTGKSGEALQKFIEEGKIGFPQIQQAFANMSAEGGKFHNLTEELSKTTGGQWSNTKDQLEQLAVSIFKELQPAINWFIKSMQETIKVVADAVKFISEYKDVIKLVGVGIATVGGTLLLFNSYLAVSNALSSIYATIQGVKLVAALTEATVAQLALNAAMDINPIMAAITAIALLATAWYSAQQAYEQYEHAVNKRVFDAIEEEKGLVDQLTKSYEKKGLAHDAAQKKAIAAEIANTDYLVKQAQKEISEIKSLGQWAMTKENSERMTIAQQNLTQYKAQRAALKDVSNFNKSGTTPSDKSLGSGLSESKESKIKHIVINLNQPFQNQKVTVDGGNLSAKDIAPLFGEYLITLAEDAALVVTE